MENLLPHNPNGFLIFIVLVISLIIVYFILERGGYMIRNIINKINNFVKNNNDIINTSIKLGKLLAMDYRIM